MAKKNCWEFKCCGQGPGCTTNKICPAATETRLNGVHGGINAGRACWAKVGTFCKGKTQSLFAMKLKECTNCDFYKLVMKEEGKDFIFVDKLLKKIEKDSLPAVKGNKHEKQS